MVANFFSMYIKASISAVSTFQISSWFVLSVTAAMILGSYEFQSMH